MGALCNINDNGLDALRQAAVIRLKDLYKREVPFSITEHVKSMYRLAYTEALKGGATEQDAQVIAFDYARLTPRAVNEVLHSLEYLRDYFREGILENKPSAPVLSMDEIDDIMRKVENTRNGIEHLNDILGLSNTVMEELRTLNQRKDEKPTVQLTKKTLRQPLNMGTAVVVDSTYISEDKLHTLMTARPWSILADKDYELTKDKTQFDKASAPWYAFKRKILELIDQSPGEDSSYIDLDGLGPVFFQVRSNRTVPDSARRSDKQSAFGDEFYDNDKSIMLVLVDESGNDIYIDAEGNASLDKTDKLAYWKFPKITEANFDENGEFVGVGTHTEEEYNDVIDSLTRKIYGEEKGLTAEELEEKRPAVEQMVLAEYRMLKDMREYIDKNPGENRLRANIKIGSFGNLNYNLNYRTPMSGLVVENENDFQIDYVDMKIDEASEEVGQVQFTLPETGDTKLRIERPELRHMGITDKLVSLIVDPIYTVKGGKTVKLTAFEKVKLLEQYFMTRGQILQIPYEDKEGRPTENKEDIKFVMFRDKRYDVNDEPSEHKDAKKDQTNRELLREKLTGFFNAPYTVTRIKKKDDLTPKQKENIVTKETAKKFGVIKVPKSKDLYYILEPVYLNISKPDSKELLATVNEFELEEEKGKLMIKDNLTEFKKYIREHFYMSYKLSPNGKIEPTNPYFIFSMDEESMNKVYPAPVKPSVKPPSKSADGLKNGDGPQDGKGKLKDKFQEPDDFFDGADKRKLQKKLNDPATAEQIAAAKKWFMNHPLNEFISFDAMFEVVNTKRPGTVANWVYLGTVLNEATKSKITLYQGSDMTDLYHEAFHGFFQMFLTKEQKQEIFDEIAKQKGSFTDYDGNYAHFDTANPKQLEEWLAEEFRSYMIKDSKPAGPKQKGFFAWLKAFITKIFANFTTDDFVSGDSIGLVKDLFDKLRVGNINDYNFSAENVSYRSLNKEGGIQRFNQEDPTENLSYEDSRMVLNIVDSLFSEFIDIKNSSNMSEKDNLKIGQLLYKKYREGKLSKSEQGILDSLTVKRTYMYSTKLLTTKKGLLFAYKYVIDRVQDQIKFFQKQLDETVDTPETSRLRTELQKKIDLLTWTNNNFGDLSELDKNRGNRGVINYHQKKSQLLFLEDKEAFFEGDLKEDLTEEEKALTEEDIELLNKSQGYESSGNSQSLEQMATKEILFLVRGLHETDPTKEYNALGFRNLIPFHKSWNHISRTLKNTLDPARMFTKLYEEATTYPAIMQLLDKLGPIETKGKNSEAFLWTNFWQTFNKSHVPLYQAVVQGSKVQGADIDDYVYDMVVGRSSAEFTKVGYKWRSIFKSASARSSKYVKVDNANRNYLDVDQVLKDFSYKDVEKDPFRFFHAIGFRLDNVSPIRDAIKGRRGIGRALRIRESLEDAQKQHITVHDFNDFLKIKRKDKSVKDETPNYKALQELQARYSDDYSNFASTTAKGNVQYEHTLNNTMTVMVDAINEAPDYKTLTLLPYMAHLDIRRNPILRGSTWLNSIFKIRGTDGQLLDYNDPEYGKRRYTQNGTKVTVEVINQSGIKITQDGYQVGEGQESAAVDEFTKIIMDYHYTLIEGSPELMRHSDKVTSHAARLSAINRPSDVGSKSSYVDTAKFIVRESGDTSITDGQIEAHDIIIRHLSAELDRVRTLKDSKINTDYDFEYLKRGQKLVVFDRVMKMDTTGKLENFLLSLDESLEDYLNTNDEAKIETARKLRIRLDEVLDIYFKDLFVEANDMFNKVREGGFVSKKLHMQIAGDARNLNRSLKTADIRQGMMMSFVYNAWIHNIETLVLFYGDPALYKIDKEEFHKRNSGIGSTGKIYRTDAAMIDHVNRMSRPYQKATTDYAIRKFDGRLHTAVLHDEAMRSIYYNEMEKALGGHESMKEYTEKGLMSEVGNAQGWVSFDAYRILLVTVGKWTDYQEYLYQQIVSGKEIADDQVRKFFPVQKLQYWGPLENKFLPLTGFHKFSLLPLIPSMIKDFELKNLHDKMMKEQVDYVLFQSGSKISTVQHSEDNQDKFYVNGEIQETPYAKNIIHMQYLKDQLEIADKFKGQNRFSTQLRKLIEDGLMENGIPVDFETDLDLNTRIEKWENLSEEQRLKNDNYALAKTYERHIAELTRRKTDELLDEAGWSRDKNGKLRGNNKDLIKFIKRELARMDVSNHELSFIQTDSKGNLKNDLSLSLSAERIERLLNSIVVNRLVRQKVSGENLVLAASVGFQSLINKFKKGYGVEKWEGFWSREEVAKQTDKVFLFGDNTDDRLNTKYVPAKTQAVIRGLDNAIGIDTKKNRGKDVDSYMTDNDFDWFKAHVDEQIQKAKDSGKTIVVPADGIGTGKAMLKEKAPKLFEYLQAQLNELTATGTFKKATEEDIKKYVGTNGLPFYYPRANGKTAAMKVMISIQGDFEHLLKLKDLDGNEIGTLDKLNELIKKDEWLNRGDHRRMITMVGVRIPVQGLNSMEFMEVYHFLPKVAGNILIPPAEMVAKSGADFDIDKLTVMTPNIRMMAGTPEYVKAIYDSKQNRLDVKRERKEIKAKIKAEEAKDAPDQKYIDRMTNRLRKFELAHHGLGTAGVENDLITDIVHILQKPENYAKLIRPNGTDIVRPLSEKLSGDVRERDYRDKQITNKKGEKENVIYGSRILEIGYNLYKHTSNNVGKQTLGIGAVDNTYNVLFNAVKMYLNRRYVTDKDVEMRQTILMPHNTLKVDGEDVISLSHLYDANTETDKRNYIGDVINQLINGWVDVAKDAWIFDIQGNKEITPTLLFMLQAGVPFEHAVYFVSQPLIREYVNQQRIAKSSLALPLGVAPSNPAFFRSQARRKILMESKYGISLKGYQPKDSDEVFLSNEKIFGHAAAVTHITVPNGFDKDELLKEIKEHKRKIKSGEKIRYSPLQRAAFLHFLELEEMGKAVRDVKMRTNVDTRPSSTLFSAQQKLADVAELYEDNRFSAEVIEKLIGRDSNGNLTESVSTISSFLVQGLQLEIWGQLFKLNNNPVLNDFLKDVVKRNAGDDLRSTYPDAEKFISQLKSGIMRFIFQNNLLPFDINNIEQYKGLNATDDVPTELIDSLTIGAFVKDGQMFISKANLERQYKYLNLPEGVQDTYALYDRLGLAPVDIEMFSTPDQYYKFVVEREYLRHVYKDKKPADFDIYRSTMAEEVTKSKGESKEDYEKRAAKEVYEMFLRDKALDNTFNPWKLFYSKSTYADQFIAIIEEFPQLKKNFLIAGEVELSHAPAGVGMRNLRLADPRIDADTIDVLYENLLDLANETKVIEGIDEDDRAYIADFFKKFPTVAFLQSGTNTKGVYSLSRIVPEHGYLKIMGPALETFTKNLNDHMLEKIYDMFLTANSRMKYGSRVRYQEYSVSKEDYESMLDAKQQQIAGPLNLSNLEEYYNKADYSVRRHYDLKPYKPGVVTYSSERIENVKDVETLIRLNPDVVFVFGMATGQADMAEQSKDGGTSSDAQFSKYVRANRPKNVVGIPSKNRYTGGIMKVNYFDDIGDNIIDIEKRAIEKIARLRDEGYTIAFSDKGYGQSLIGVEKIDKVGKNTAPKYFDLLSRDLFTNFGFVNGAYFVTKTGRTDIQSYQKIDDTDVLEEMRNCILNR